MKRCEAGTPLQTGDGSIEIASWLDYCERFGIYHLFTEEYVHGLARRIRELNPVRILEICAGNGQLSQALSAYGMDVLATDSGAWEDIVLPGFVERLSAREALRKYAPDLVLGCWVPIDTDIDVQVLRSPSVRHYLYIAGESNGLIGSEAIWREPGRQVEELEEIGPYSLCRSDFLLHITRGDVVTHSRAFLFRRGRKA